MDTMIGIIGLGNFGSAIAHLITQNGFPVLGWDYEASVVTEINQTHTNTLFLPGTTFSPNLKATHDLSQIAQQCEIIFIAIHARYLRQTLAQLPSTTNTTTFVNLAKGFDPVTECTGWQTVKNHYPQHPVIMLSGPSIANELVQGLPTTVVIAGQNQRTISPLLASQTLDLVFSNDVIGTELGGILKNIYALGLGLLDGSGVTSIDQRAVYLTEALAEMTRMGVALGAQAETFLSVAGLGDLLATALSPDSHNRTFGARLMRGEPIHTQPEGVTTLPIILKKAAQLGIQLPLAEKIAQQIGDIKR